MANLPQFAKVVLQNADDVGDDELMVRARDGSDVAFEALVRRHQEFALAVAYKYLGNESAARDAAQAAFVEVFRKTARYRAQGKFRGYFYRVVLNQCRMQSRRKRYQSALQEASRAQAATSATRGQHELHSLEQQELVDTLLRRLPTRLKTVVILRYAGGLSLAEIAENLKIPVGTVKSRLFTGIDRMRRILEEDQP